MQSNLDKNVFLLHRVHCFAQQFFAHARIRQWNFQGSSTHTNSLDGNQKPPEVEGIGLFVAWFYTAPWFLYPLCEELDTTFLKSRLIGRSRRHVSDVCQFITELCICRCQSSGQRSHLFESSSSIFSWDKWQYPPPLLVHNE